MLANPGAVRKRASPRPIGQQLAVFTNKEAKLFNKYKSKGCKKVFQRRMMLHPRDQKGNWKKCGTRIT